MKCVYEPANALDAHMLANLLEQHDIHARIDGEQLIGGVGDLPAAGLIRLMADDADFDRAREIIRKWETQPTSPDLPRRQRTWAHSVFWFLCGSLLTGGTLYFLNQSDVSEEGIDVNNDGTIDEHYHYVNRRLRSIESDRNFDGVIDVITEYDQQGLPTKTRQDDDFDGKFEQTQTYEFGWPKSIDYDWDLGGKVDRRDLYEHGVIKASYRYAANGYTVLRLEEYKSGNLVRAEYDSDGDGKIDTVTTYDRSGNALDTTKKN